MRLFISPASPFVRKCRIVIREKGLTGRVEEVVADPYADDPDLLKANPIAQIPALIDDQGRAWADSPLICQWLDFQGSGPRLVPDGEARWDVLRRESAADGVLELGVKWLLELRRPETERSAHWMNRWREGILRGLDAIEARSPAPEPFDLGVISLGCALTWLDFRHPGFDWKTGRPKLVALQAALETRPSFVETTPR